ncbi:hypothetical protein CYLTODRAFT_460205 [Cylindrobasidium torrendii FP15055 ss-10]|uniref:Uncharacterized protein n=1 Tax=Cylindrobasidium torrendii FP15055 ss-10 TaxID=1314674 RepID=A0A0D7ASM2_9AGAR|nr:hypothetical protein CYLTODRAFT_460205 [Cylindrobasidium torrendii FP15055 ss-10]
MPQMSSTRVQRAEHDGSTRSWSTPLKGIFRAGKKEPTPPVAMASLVRSTTPLSIYGQSPPLSQASLRMTPLPARNRRISQSPIRSLFDAVCSRPSTPLRPPSTPPGAERAALQSRRDPKLQSRSTLSLETQRAPLPNHVYGSPSRQSESHETPRRLTVDIQPSFRATDLDLNARLHSAPASPTSASTDLVHQYPFAKTNLKGKGKAVFQSEPELLQSYVNRWLQPRKDSDQTSEMTLLATPTSPQVQERARDVPGKLYDSEPYKLAPVLRQWPCESDARLEWDHGLDRYMCIPTHDILETPAAMGERQLTRMVIILPTYDVGLPADRIIINASNLTAIDVLRVIFSHYRQPIPAEDVARIPEFFKSRGFRQAYEKRLQSMNDRKREEAHIRKSLSFLGHRR